MYKKSERTKKIFLFSTCHAENVLWSAKAQKQKKYKRLHKSKKAYTNKNKKTTAQNKTNMHLHFKCSF